MGGHVKALPGQVQGEMATQAAGRAGDQDCRAHGGEAKGARRAGEARDYPGVGSRAPGPCGIQLGLAGQDVMSVRARRKRGVSFAPLPRFDDQSSRSDESARRTCLRRISNISQGSEAAAGIQPQNSVWLEKFSQNPAHDMPPKPNAQ